LATYGERCDATGRLIHTCDCTRHARTSGLTRDDGWVASGVGDYLYHVDREAGAHHGRHSGVGVVIP